VLKGKAGDDVLKAWAAMTSCTARSGNDKLYGGSGDDKLCGGSGDDRLTGGAGQDTFVFERRGGSDTVTDFRDGHDKIDVSRLAGVDSLADLAHWQAGDDVVIWHNSDVLVLKGVDLSDLDSRDFIF
jgi:Ca2+-binding RTX toxin-like protein